MNKTANQYQIHTIYILLAVVTFIAFEPIIHNGFISFDDDVYIYQNNHVTSGLTLKNIIWAFTNIHANNYHPLTSLSHMLDCELYGTKAGGHHFTNLLFHIANTLLLFTVLSRMTKQLWASAFVAALFALHPLHVESVAWASERKDTLSTFFWMLTMWAYIHYCDCAAVPAAAKPRHSNGGAKHYYILSIVLFTLGLLSKPMLVTLPFVLLLLDYWPLGRFKKVHLSRLIFEKIPFLVLSAILSVVTFMVQQKTGMVKTFSNYPLPWRIENALISYIIYIEKMFWPAKLAIFYPHAGSNVSILYAVISAVLLLAVTILIVRFAKNHRYLVTGWFWYLGTLVPVIGLIQIGQQAMADRYSYISLTGLFIIIAWGIPELLRKWRYGKIVLGQSAVLVILAVSICTHFQISHWRNDLTLFQHAIDVTEDSHMVMNNLAWILATSDKTAVRNPDKAVNLARRACELTNYKNPFYLDTLGAAFAAAGNFSRAVEIAQKAIGLCQSGQRGSLKKEIENRLTLYMAGKPYIKPLLP
ncbi:MAG: hypothetical protein WCE45_03030 [Sedimentisphaerales bacterium]